MSGTRITRSRLLLVSALVCAALAFAGVGPSAAQRGGGDSYRVTALGGSTLKEINGEKVLEFPNGVRIEHGNVTITSRRAFHYTDRRVTNLIGDVKIVQETMTMWGDEGVYTGPTDEAVLSRNVRIVDQGWEVTCDEARYSRTTGHAWLTGHVVARDSVSTLTADKLFYNRLTERTEAFGNVTVTNKDEGFTASGRHGLYFRGRGEAIIDQEPRLTVDPDQPEPVTIVSDTMRVYPDSSRALAYYRVKIIKGNTVTQCDSAVLYDDAQRAELYGHPLAKQENVSMAGNMMALHYNDDEVYRIDIGGDAEIRETQKDSLVVGRDSWIQGDAMSLFTNENHVDSILVQKNARSEYFPAGDRKVESNFVGGDEMFFRFEKDSLSYVRVRGHASGVYRYIDLADDETVDSLRVVADSTLKYRPFKRDSQKVVYNADHLEYFADRGDLVLDQQATLKYQNSELTGDDITYYSNLHMLDATGEPTLTDNGEKFYGRRMDYDMESQAGLVTDGSTKFGEGYYTGENVAKVGDNEMKVWGSNYTTCDLKVPHYHFQAKEMKVYPNDKVITGPIWLYIGDTPIAYLPFMAANLRRGRRSGILRPDFEFGFDRSSGRYIRNWGYYWATNDYTDFGFRGDFNENSSFRIYAQERYALRYRFTGNVDYNYFRNLHTRTNEWEVNARHSHTLGENFSFNSDLHFVSSDAALHSINRIDNVNRVIDRSIRSNVVLSKRWDTVAFNASASRTQNLNITQPTAEKLTMTAPDLTLSIPGRNLYFGETGGARKGLWESILTNTRYTPRLSGRRTYRETGLTKQDVVTLNQGLTLSSNLKLAFLNFSPSVTSGNVFTHTVSDTFRHDETRIDNTVDPPDTSVVTVAGRRVVADDNAFSWNTGAGVNTNFYGTFYPHVGRLRGIRHTVTPSASWSYTPDIGNKGPSRQAFSVSLRQALDLKVASGTKEESGAAGGVRTTPDQDTGVITEESPGEEKVTKLSGVAIWNLSSSYNPKAPAKKKWSTVSSSVNANLLGTSVSLNQRVDPYKFDILSTTVTSGVRWSGTHPFGRSSSVTVRELNVVAAHDTASSQSSAGLSIEETGDMPEGGRDQSALAIEEGRLPWSVQMDVSYSKVSNSEPRSTLQLSGNMDLTPAWSISYSTTYDVEGRLLLGQSYHITRDLHCWQMSFSRQKLGDEWQFYFRISLKAHEEIYAEQGQRGLGGGSFGASSLGF